MADEFTAEAQSSPSSPSHLERNLFLFARLSVATAITVGLVGLTGALLDIVELRAVLPGQVAMKANAAIGIILLGIALILLDSKHAIGLRRRRIAQALSLFVAVVGALSFLEFLAGWEFGIDQLILPEPVEQAAGSIRPGLMAPITAVDFVLVGSALLLLDWRPRRFWVSQVLALFSALVAAFGLFDFILHGGVTHTYIAFPTAIVLLALSSSIICSRRDRGLGALLASPRLGGTIVRGLLPPSLLVPSIIAYVRWRNYEEGLFSEWFSVTLITLFAISLLAGLTAWTALLVDRADRERRGAAERLRVSEERYRSLVIATTQIVWTTDADGRVISDMPTWRAFTGMTVEEMQGWGWINSLHPDDRERTTIIWNQALNCRSLYETEYRVRRNDGQYRHMTVRGAPVLQSDGSIREWVGTCTDITARKDAENELREQAALLNLAHDAIIVLDLEQRVLYWNRGAEDTYGWSSQQAHGSISHELLRTTFPLPLEQITAILTQKGQWSGELQHVRSDGTPIVVASRWSLQREENGNPKAILEINRDITERRQIEQELRLSQERLALAHKAGRSGTFDWDIQNNVNRWSPEIEELYGLVAGGFGGTFEAWEALVHPEDLPAARAGIAASLKSGEFCGEWRIRRPGDPQLRWLSARARVLFDELGRPTRMTGINVDITERKRMEEALRSSEAELATKNAIAEVFLTVTDNEMYGAVLKIFLQVSHSEHGLFGYIDEDGAIVYPSMTLVWDRCQVTDKKVRYPRESWTGIWGRSMVEKRSLYSNEPKHVPEGHVPIRRVLVVPILFQQELIGQFEVANKSTDYTPADVATLEHIAHYLAPVLNARLQRDREEHARKQAEQEIRRLNNDLEARVRQRTAELQASNKELEAFTYSVSHDLRAPLRHISGFSKILLEEFAAQMPSEAQHYLTKVADGTRRMGTLVDDLLNLARVGRSELRTQVTGLSSVVEEVRAELAPECGDRHVEWRIGALPFVECDPSLLKQVFHNLMSNALKFTRPRNPAIIEIGQVQEHGPVFVRDNGVGFSMKYADKLFGVFQRLHRPEDFEGTGVGLATVQRIVRKHGGTIWAEAELDKGATFYFTITTSEASQPTREVAAVAGG